MALCEVITVKLMIADFLFRGSVIARKKLQNPELTGSTVKRKFGELLVYN
jgi:hypothetical protein